MSTLLIDCVCVSVFGRDAVKSLLVWVIRCLNESRKVTNLRQQKPIMDSGFVNLIKNTNTIRLLTYQLRNRHLKTLWERQRQQKNPQHQSMIGHKLLTQTMNTSPRWFYTSRRYRVYHFVEKREQMNVCSAWGAVQSSRRLSFCISRTRYATTHWAVLSSLGTSLLPRMKSGISMDIRICRFGC